MLNWVLILMLHGQYELLGTYSSQAECEKAADVMAETGKTRNERVGAGCYQKKSVISYSG